MNMSTSLTMVMFSWVYTYIQTHQIVYIIYAQFYMLIIVQKTIFKKYRRLGLPQTEDQVRT
jgi:hypothetical protein